jgi:hypothetical protein
MLAKILPKSRQVSAAIIALWLTVPVEGEELYTDVRQCRAEGGHC